MSYYKGGDWGGGGNKLKNTDHHKVGSVYGGRGLDRYTGLDRGYICVVICGATCDGIDEAIDADIP